MSAATNVPASSPRIESLYRYPIKGLTAEPLLATTVEAGGCLPFDRAYAIENGGGRFDPLRPKYLPKINFLMLMRNERLASLRSTFDDATETLTIYRDGSQVAQGQLKTPIGRQLIEQFLSSYFVRELRGGPKIVHATGHSFSDVPMKCLHIVNLASIRELKRVAGRDIDPLRFRANVYIDGLEPWREFEWVNQNLQIGDAELAVLLRTERCDATNVDPETATRDMSIPSLLQRHWGHTDFGIYAKITKGGEISIKDEIRPV